MANIIKRERWGYTWETIYGYVRVGERTYDFCAQTIQFYGGKPIYMVTAPGLAPFRTIDLDDAKAILRHHYSGNGAGIFWCPIASTFGMAGYRSTKARRGENGDWI